MFNTTTLRHVGKHTSKHILLSSTNRNYIAKKQFFHTRTELQRTIIFLLAIILCLVLRVSVLLFLQQQYLVVLAVVTLVKGNHPGPLIPFSPTQSFHRSSVFSKRLGFLIKVMTHRFDGNLFFLTSLVPKIEVLGVYNLDRCQGSDNFFSTDLSLMSCSKKGLMSSMSAGDITTCLAASWCWKCMYGTAIFSQVCLLSQYLLELFVLSR